MLANQRIAIRSFSSALRLANVAASAFARHNSSAINSGSFKTFAEYRTFIIKKDPEHLKTRHEIMYSDGKPESCPESEAENNSFSSEVKKVAYNA
ncbi:hypothetical protein DAPK24_026210 [Pichia kluyveri]|uniref:Uncharacterized protein n=1 Tax=Pichia kluyveri TaxID=36015 RepID=A0AAV5R616_PICKL|nr:hypothetical protein DAPK24_026210 [Pichia kluyveri]